ncbi:protein of unknown function [Paraburkholderia dioscoreae]|uniref:Uncharacterized protein n=1 Tax=Paraburkholderia dioscoreae TaxID=2604047 RepID=A0A5Q4Z7A5_9BURK|nr:protein of unknown function [Paraburkholderia dioscoreae]
MRVGTPIALPTSFMMSTSAPCGVDPSSAVPSAGGFDRSEQNARPCLAMIDAGGATAAAAAIQGTTPEHTMAQTAADGSQFAIREIIFIPHLLSMPN